jgi:hypothetical protein
VEVYVCGWDMSSSVTVNVFLPSWGSKGWRTCTKILAVLILVYGAWLVISDIMEGYVLWWYNLSLVLFGFTLLGLVMLVAEGLSTLRNVAEHGFHPRLVLPPSSETETEAVETPERTQPASEQEGKR